MIDCIFLEMALQLIEFLMMEIRAIEIQVVLKQKENFCPEKNTVNITLWLI